MPIVWTHIQFCEDVIDSINHTNLFLKYEQYMKFGAQGANALHYNRFLFPRHKNQLLLEESKNKTTNEILLQMIAFAKNENEQIKAYVFGFITHHILESKIRPYINYLDNLMEKSYSDIDERIDTLFMKNHYNFQTWNAPVYKEINIGFSMDKNIISFLNKVNHPIAQYIKRSYLWMQFMLRVYYDPYNWKGKVLTSYNPIYTANLANHEGIDWLNEQNSIWVNKDVDKSSNISFMQLYNEAKIEVAEIMIEVLHFWTCSTSTQLPFNSNKFNTV